MKRIILGTLLTIACTLSHCEVVNSYHSVEPPVATVIEPLTYEHEIMEVNVIEEDIIVDEVIDTTVDANIIEISDDEYNELARIIMAEAEGEDLDGKILVGNVVMNRVNSSGFPDDIISVVRQERNGVYQFSPVGNGRIDRVTPSEDCYMAVDMILQGYDISDGALYFESCDGDSWHSRNLELLFKHGGHRFYK